MGPPQEDWMGPPQDRHQGTGPPREGGRSGGWGLCPEEEEQEMEDHSISGLRLITKEEEEEEGAWKRP